MTKHRPGQRGPLVALLALFLIPPFFLTYRSLSAGNASAFVPIGIDWIFLPPEFPKVNQTQQEELPEEQRVITIPYAVSITSCKKRELVMDGASVLQHSIHLNSIRTPNSGSHYDYEMVAFVHPEAVECIEILDTLNYTVLMKEVPFDVTQIRGPYRNVINQSGCCGEREWLKLYAYTLTQYPVVVHLDLDCLILKPLDNLFDAMIMPANTTNGKEVASARARIPAMWVNATDLPKQIDFFFTRDYGMISEPGYRKVPQIGVQGGFLVVRPNVAAFQEYIDLILEGFYNVRQGWGGKLAFGGYYGLVPSRIGGHVLQSLASRRSGRARSLHLQQHGGCSVSTTL
ncbi:hypothetical protein MHU86_8453 [Fragilaria crotonensis]|nr:hypothetical protein MHU86_8453 [Fragilaria crotonensis]